MLFKFNNKTRTWKNTTKRGATMKATEEVKKLQQRYENNQNYIESIKEMHKIQIDELKAFFQRKLDNKDNYIESIEAYYLRRLTL